MFHELPNLRTVLGILNHASLSILLTIKGNLITRHSFAIQFMTASIFKLEVSIYTPMTRHFSGTSDMIFLFVKDIVESKWILISWVCVGLLSYLRYNTSSLNILKLIKNVMSFTWEVCCFFLTCSLTFLVLTCSIVSTAQPFGSHFFFKKHNMKILFKEEYSYLAGGK